MKANEKQITVKSRRKLLRMKFCDKITKESHRERFDGTKFRFIERNKHYEYGVDMEYVKAEIDRLIAVEGLIQFYVSAHMELGYNEEDILDSLYDSVNMAREYSPYMDLIVPTTPPKRLLHKDTSNS